MSSLSPVIQGLLVALLPEYEIANDAIGYISEFSERFLTQLARDSVQSQKTIVSALEVHASIKKYFPEDWATIIASQGIAQLSSLQNEEKDSLKQEISDFELIDGDSIDERPKEGAINKRENLFLSADFIKSFLPSEITSRLDTEACVLLSACTENVMSTLIQESCATPRKPGEDAYLITKQILVDTILRYSRLLHLTNSLKLGPKAVVDVVKQEYAAKPAHLEESIEPIEEPEEEPEAPEEPEKFEKPEEPEEPEVLAESPIEPEIAKVDEYEANEEQIKQAECVQQAEEAVEEAPVKVEEKQEADEEINKQLSANIPSIPPLPSVPQDQDVEESSFPIVDLYQDPDDVAMVTKPILALHGQCCPYFDITSLAIHMLSSILEYFIRQLLSESRRSAFSTHTPIQKAQARAALRRLTASQSIIMDALSRAESGGQLFSECIYHAMAKGIPSGTEWEAGLETCLSGIVLYATTHLLLVASAHSRIGNAWTITSKDISFATSQFISDSSPITKIVSKLNSEHISATDEGQIISPPPAPRIRAAEMIYLTSIIKETPLQLDNQLLIIFMFLVSLSLHTLCCVRCN